MLRQDDPQGIGRRDDRTRRAHPRRIRAPAAGVAIDAATAWPPPMLGPTGRAGSAPPPAAEVPAEWGGTLAARVGGRTAGAFSPSTFQE